MKFKLDENMPEALVQFLTKAGHDVETVLNEQLSGAKDQLVLEVASREKRILLTFDTDFADIRAYPLGTHAGIVVFRLKDQRWQTLRGSVENLFKEPDMNVLFGSLVVVGTTRIRYRRQKN